MFETYGMKKFFIASSAVMLLYDTGRTTGLAVDVGADMTHITPIYEGFVLAHAVTKHVLAGNALTKYLQTLLNSNGSSFQTPDELSTVQKIKEEHCFIAQDYDAEYAAASAGSEKDQSYTLPDST